ncbi:hypothetical protein HDU97_002682 [Phlyctochytrium planicorne]|nr:hypothetical protein HDU97_002682 [Phlyctochytrium planicorne]
MTFHHSTTAPRPPPSASTSSPIHSRPSSALTSKPPATLKSQATHAQTTNLMASALAASVVKEYLSAKGLEKTLEAFRLEYLQYQKGPLVSSRNELAKSLGIGKILNANKASGNFCMKGFWADHDKPDQPLKSQLEVVVKSLATKASSAASSKSSESAPTASPRTSVTTPATATQVPSPATLFSTDKHSPPTVTFNTPLGGFDSRNPRAISGTGWNPAATGRTSPRSGSTPPISTVTSGWGGREEAESPSLEPARDIPGAGGKDIRSSIAGSRPGTTSDRKKPSYVDDLEVTDDVSFDDDDSDVAFGMNSLSLPSQQRRDGSKGSLITTQRAMQLRRVTFGGEGERVRGTFSEEWRGKGFVFQTVGMTGSGVPYGLVQIKGGPCGLLAVVQAYIVKYLAWSGERSGIRNGKLKPTPSQCRFALLDAMAEILWQAGGTRNRRAVVALFKPNLRVSAKSDVSRERYIPDGITENLEVHEFSDMIGLREFLQANLDSFLNNDPYRHGLIQLLYSAVLSRGPETIREEDFDEPGCSLIGRHSYCTQELVNLLMMGQAISNVHDGDIHLDGGNGAEGDVKVLKGFKKQQQFGYLTLFEHYGSLKVGDYLKNPTLPIFVICSESHFTVMFSLDEKPLSVKTTSAGGKSAIPPKGFELIYYDGLAGQENEIRLVVKKVEGRWDDDVRKAAKEGKDSSLVPPLELVIGTRWENPAVEWIGSEPLL